MGQNHIVDEDVPVAYPVENYEAPAEIPIAEVIQTDIPIAVPVDTSAQEARIRELETTNQITRMRTEGLQTRLRQEEDKQRRQRYELERVQKELESNKAKQKEAEGRSKSLERIKRQQQIEQDFSTLQVQLLNEYVMRINTAAEQKSLGNFDKAIQEYNLAIDLITRLMSEYKTKEYSKGNIFPNIPPAYNEHIIRARFEIVNCLQRKGLLLQAYDYLDEYARSSGNAQIFAVRKMECRDLIYTHAKNLIANAANVNVNAGNMRITSAIEHLNAAEELLRKIAESPDADFYKRRKCLEWALKGKQLNEDCQLLLQGKIYLGYDASIVRARYILAEYKKYTDVLSAAEHDFQLRLCSVLQVLEQVAAQMKINELLPQVKKHVMVGDLVTAHAVMAKICDLAVSITKPEYLEQNGLVFTHPEVYYKQLSALELAVQNFKERYEQQHHLIIDKILATAIAANTKHNKNATMFEKDIKVLKNTLGLVLKSNWHKFDSRPVPQSLINDTAALIIENTTSIGMLRRWYNWTYATTCLKDSAKVMNSIKEKFNNYIPGTLPDNGIEVKIR